MKIPSKTQSMTPVVQWDGLSKVVNYANPFSYFMSAAPKARRSGTVDEFIEQAKSRLGAAYDWAEKPDPSNNDPRGMDCAGLVRWAAGRAGAGLPEGSQNQMNSTKTISVDQALKTRGALLFKKEHDGHPGHVAISLGDGRYIESSMPLGVMYGSNASKFTSGGLIGGLNYKK